MREQIITGIAHWVFYYQYILCELTNGFVQLVHGISIRRFYSFGQ